ncbi:hypothetical protein IT084_12310 [Desulfallas sp. Bu1-1]|uniref:hypothetical protein n=1 Tax=Desulfallas sp. Bu1-1 TaxID=2787620 RepID=UPI00189F779C|nr:hypothetical protein [Desulfallas sp. Bu1-1]MBF7083756.1 hypothetical protein [Desulfallas sp. Bu1-1]
MKQNTIFRLTIGGDSPRQYHLQSRWVVEIYIQTYRQIGKQVNLEQLVDGIWQPASI